VARERCGGKMRVLEKQGDQLKVRDDEGNEGWIDEKAAVKR
jgi:hypothetical protein